MLGMQQGTNHLRWHAVQAVPRRPATALQPQAHVLQVKPVNHPLLTCFALSAGFAPLPDSSQGGNTAGRLAEVTFGVALRTEVPADLPVTKLEVSMACGVDPQFSPQVLILHATWRFMFILVPTLSYVFKVLMPASAH